MHVLEPQVAAQVMHIPFSRLILSHSQSALNNILQCDVTNWADPVTAEEIGNNGV